MLLIEKIMNIKKLRSLEIIVEMEKTVGGDDEDDNLPF
jgi:hypothetical protein